MKRKRDIQGKFTLKDKDYRQVRSLRLTDATWKALGFAAERYELSRADLLENLVKQNQGNFPDIYDIYPQKPILKTNIMLNQEELNQKVHQVLGELKLGKQAPKYKLVQKNLNRLIELILLSSK